jgi:hypothetical protein
MKFQNLKTCHGLETHVLLNGALVRLSELPAALRALRDEELTETLRQLFREMEPVPMDSWS